MIKKIPKPIIEIIQKLEAAGFEAFIVGGCVRDLLMDVEPKDWDVTTNAKPEEVMKIFSDSFYENVFGTVGIKVNLKNPSLILPLEKGGRVDVVAETPSR